MQWNVSRYNYIFFLLFFLSKHQEDFMKCNFSIPLQLCTNGEEEEEEEEMHIILNQSKALIMITFFLPLTWHNINVITLIIFCVRDITFLFMFHILVMFLQSTSSSTEWCQGDTMSDAVQVVGTSHCVGLHADSTCIIFIPFFYSSYY